MAAMRQRTGRLEVASPAGIPRGAWLQIGDGDESDVVQVLAVRGTTLKVGRVRWWHRLLWRLSALPRAAGWLVRRGLCAAARHRVTRESFGLRHCWCRRRWEDGADWDDEDEDGCE
jgi:hypothetical protein